MMKWIILITLWLFIGILIAASLSAGVSYRRASLIGGMNALKLAQVNYTERGYITNYPNSGYDVRLSTNVVTISNTQYSCFAEAADGMYFDGGKLAMTTNQIFIWLDIERSPKIVTTSYRPPLFSKRY